MPGLPSSGAVLFGKDLSCLSRFYEGVAGLSVTHSEAGLVVLERPTALGGGLRSKQKEFVARGFRACDGHDPEGNVIQFREQAL